MSQLQSMPVVRETRPRRRGNRKLLFLLFVFFISLMGVLFFQSSFSKIHRLEVQGYRLLSEADILEAAGIKPGDHFFAVGAREMERRIELLQVVDSATVVKRFPGSVEISVKEYPVVALELNAEGALVGLLSNGFSVAYAESMNAAPRPLLTGWEDDKLKKSLCRVLGTIAPELLSDVSEIRPSPKQSYNDRILIYTRSHYEVITRISYLAEKISLLDDYVYEMKSSGRTTGRIVLLETDHGETFEQAQSPDSSEDTELEKETIQ
ncbi:cell division protein FtsQ/DivIB [Paenibacillus alkalitolerans]|uniref:cell division protein FtsQ/DivIB n=1 Tax=Paenibacillus alkalitolerans TaxID=2799335 RepID=UPI0018F34411|nr:FtsQ-type POTRA domain-containing protein [Paenibacillus alkalitolerans]